jgi:fatty acid desaturase
MAATYWWNKHLVVHHPHPNVIGVDDDADLMPYFAFTRQQTEGARGLRRLYFRVQGLFFPLALIGNGFNVQYLGWRYLFAHLRDPRKRQILHWLDLATLALHYAFWVGLPLLVLPLGEVLLLYFVRLALMGFALFGAFAPAHFPHEAAAFEKGKEQADFFYLQTAGTVNFHSNAYGRLLCSGVDYQIEHHLFPHVSHLHYPKLAPIVADYARRHGYPYQTLGWGEATWKCFKNMSSPKVMRVGTQPPAGSIAPAGSVKTPAASPSQASAT